MDGQSGRGRGPRRGQRQARGRASGGIGVLIDPDSSWDLRRKRRREVIERVVERAELLSPADRALILAYYRDEQSALDIARLACEPVRAVRRRLRRVVQRVLSPRFQFVASRRRSWPPTRRRVASACVLEGFTLREASRRLGLSLHSVRRHHDAIQAMFEDERGPAS